MVHYQPNDKECQRHNHKIKQNKHKILLLDGDEWMGVVIHAEARER